MDINEIALLLVGAVLGAIVTAWYNATTQNLYRWVTTEMARQARAGHLGGIAVEQDCRILY